MVHPDHSFDPCIIAVGNCYGLRSTSDSTVLKKMHASFFIKTGFSKQERDYRDNPYSVILVQRACPLTAYCVTIGEPAVCTVLHVKIQVTWGVTPPSQNKPSVWTGWVHCHWESGAITVVLGVEIEGFPVIRRRSDCDCQISIVRNVCDISVSTARGLVRSLKSGLN